MIRVRKDPVANRARVKAWRDKKKAEDHKTLWRKKNPERDKNNRLLSAFGISLGEYNEMLARQGGVCAICAKFQTRKGSKYLSVDHCHKTMKIRGLLCSKCNHAIGQFNDDPIVAANAYLYLQAHNGGL